MLTFCAWGKITTPTRHDNDVGNSAIWVSSCHVGLARRLGDRADSSRQSGRHCLWIPMGIVDLRRHQTTCAILSIACAPRSYTQQTLRHCVVATFCALIPPPSTPTCAPHPFGLLTNPRMGINVPDYIHTFFLVKHAFCGPSVQPHSQEQLDYARASQTRWSSWTHLISHRKALNLEKSRIAGTSPARTWMGGAPSFQLHSRSLCSDCLLARPPPAHRSATSCT